jgi:sirohydrochlorin ferrochelatase
MIPSSNPVPSDSHSSALDHDDLGVILVDHGSRRDESNHMLLDVVKQFATATKLPIVEPAHMELAEPSIATAFDRCVAQGAKTVVVFPYFLLPGRHWHDDIPRLAAEAAAKYPGVKFLVTAPLALHPLMSEIIRDRRAAGDADACDACGDAVHCELREGRA